MDPIQAINVLSQVVKGARLPYNEHVVLERCVDVLLQAVQQKNGTSSQTAQELSAPVTFEEPDVVVEDAPVSVEPLKTKARARARKKN